MPRFVAYYRVSTAKQGLSGLGLDAQRDAVQSFVRSKGASLLAETVEIESGSRSHRQGLAEALRLCRLHDAVLLIAKLDRLARNVAFVSSLMESNVDFIAVDFPGANRLTVHILAAVAEHEVQLIRDRTKLALRAAKARGTKLGGDRGNLRLISDQGREASAKARSARARRRAEDLGPLLKGLRAKGHSIRQMADELHRRGIAPPRSARWSSSQLHRLLKLVP